MPESKSSGPERAAVDLPVLGIRDRDERNSWSPPEGIEFANLAARRPGESEGSDLAEYVLFQHDRSLDWDDLAWIRSLSPLPLLLKGIVTAEDAARAVDEGVDGIIVSNHGGRQLDGAPATLDVLPEVGEACAGTASYP